MQTFAERVREIVKKIPKGTVMSYGEVAKATGNPKAARAVANTMAANFDKTVPCHRVVLSDGRLGGYNRGGEEVKRALLINEGYNSNNISYMDTKQLQLRISRALGSSNIHIQNTALIALIGEVTNYVNQIKEEEEIIREIGNYDRQISLLSRDKDNPEAETELREAQSVLNDAKEVRRNMERKKQTIKNLRRDVESLHQELKSI